jgi:predicted metal-binding protein
VARGAGAARAGAIRADDVVVDERVTMKCRFPPCEIYGTNHMCPPYSPTASEFARYLAAYKDGVLLQVQDKLPDGFGELVEQTEDNWYWDLYKREEFKQAYDGTMMPLWYRLHAVALAVESQAQQLGHRGAVALAGSDCGFCSPMGARYRERLQIGTGRPAPGEAPDALNGCDVSKPCPFPDAARPAMEAVGIDVVRTLRRVGWELKFPATDYLEEGVAQWTGLVLVA